MVVAKKALTGETVDLNWSQLAASTLTDGGAGPGKAFVALIGADGAVNLTAADNVHLVGVLNAAGAGFAADGTPLSGTALTTLVNEVTKIDNIMGTLATDYTGKANPTQQSYVPNALNAYVFASGSTYYTIWTDGTVTPTDPAGNSPGPIYQPAPAVDPTPVFGTFAQFTKTGIWSSGKLGIDAAGLTTLWLGDGSALAYAAVIEKGVTGTVIHGDNGANGGDWFGLGQSGGNNYIYGSPAGDVFDLQNSTSLVDILSGGLGFDVVLAKAAGADVDLTANNATTGKAAKQIDAVVGGATTVQTVEINPNTLSVTLDATGAKTAIFEALLGSSADTLTLEGAGKWVEVASFAPGAPLPAHAMALQGGPVLDALYAGGNHTAENALEGYLFEQVGYQGAPLKYVTIYTDATLSNSLLAPSAAVMAQAMSAYGASSGGSGAPLTNLTTTNGPVTLVSGQA